ncbi:RING finger protein 151-like [Polyodon spathula]|uniref:RING finger protein 151-like n=1 Tax=Polyodon spathula TaxID=7913 RepID=UPI001B7E6EFF|nr:RING finger protein 151-like [Polyodon spathula]
MPSHVFCKRCFLQWLKRQKTCPFCRKAVYWELMLVLFKLSKSVRSLKMKCKNEIHGYCAISPLSYQYGHCDFKVTSCPNEGCDAEVTRKELARHLQSCKFWAELCRMSCGTMLTQSHKHHNCYWELKREFEAQSTHKAIAVKLKVYNL